MKKTVFIINQNKEEVREIHHAIMKITNKTECFVYSNGITALRRLYEVQQKPALIILDLQMPLVGSRDWLELLKHEPSVAGIPVIVCSDRKAIETSKEPIDRYAFDYFARPVPIHRLQKSLSTILISGNATSSSNGELSS